MKTKDTEVRIQNLCQPVRGSAPPGDDRENEWEWLPFKIFHRILIQIRKQNADIRVGLDGRFSMTQCPIDVRNAGLEQRGWGKRPRSFIDCPDRTRTHDL